MNKNCKLTIGAMLLLTTAFSVAEVRAQTCVVPPTCEGLGYDKAASDCGGLAKLRCPFDDSKYFCTAYTDQDGNKAIAVGDIAYSDGTYSAVPVPSKIPVGVVYSTSGKFIALSFQKTEGIDCRYTVTGKECSSYTANNTGSWTNPTKEELDVVYANKAKIDATLLNLSATSLGTGNYVYGNYSNDPIGISFSTGQTAYFGTCSTQGVIRCVNTLANLANGTTPTPTPTPTTYKVGDTYVKDGIALGKVVEVDSSGQHGILAVSMGQGDASTANSVCVAKTNGGLNWGLATGIHACTLVKNAGTVIEHSYSSDEITCGIHSASGSGACQNSKYHTGPIRKNCESTNMLGYVCEAAF